MTLQLERLKKSYVAPDGSSVPVIDVESFALSDGEQVALVGGSGTGKTTLLHLIAGILLPDSGRIVYQTSEGSTEITQLSEGQRDVFRGRNLGYIFQSHHLLPGFTALENVLLGMTFAGSRGDPAWARHLLESVGLKERLHYKPAKLSVGQQQRVAVARAMANRPRVVLADEPTGALDPRTAQQVLELIRALVTEVQASLLLVSHDPSIVKQLPRQVQLSELNRASVVYEPAAADSQPVAAAVD